jgi:hypothetical protein
MAGRRLPSALLATRRRGMNQPSPSPMLERERGEARCGGANNTRSFVSMARWRGALFRRSGTEWKWRR